MTEGNAQNEKGTDRKTFHGTLFHSFLFAAQHFSTPWMLITRTLGLLPLLFGVKKKNIYVGIIVHILCNMMNVVTGIAFMVRMAYAAVRKNRSERFTRSRNLYRLRRGTRQEEVSYGRMNDERRIRGMK